jgi:hypothetical protein
MIEINETVLGFYYNGHIEFPYDSILAKHPAFPLIILWRFTECNSFHKLPVNGSIRFEVIEEKLIPDLSMEEEAYLSMFENGVQLRWYKCKWVS